MRRSRFGTLMRTIIAVIVLAWLGRASGDAQEDPSTFQEMVERGPRFLLAMNSGPPVPIDIERTPILRERIAVDLIDVPIDEALITIARQAGIRLTYSRT